MGWIVFSGDGGRLRVLLQSCIMVLSVFFSFLQMYITAKELQFVFTMRTSRQFRVVGEADGQLWRSVLGLGFDFIRMFVVVGLRTEGEGWREGVGDGNAEVSVRGIVLCYFVEKQYQAFLKVGGVGFIRDFEVFFGVYFQVFGVYLVIAISFGDVQFGVRFLLLFGSFYFGLVYFAVFIEEILCGR